MKNILTNLLPEKNLTNSFYTTYPKVLTLVANTESFILSSMMVLFSRNPLLSPKGKPYIVNIFRNPNKKLIRATLAEHPAILRDIPLLAFGIAI